MKQLYGFAPSFKGLVPVDNIRRGDREVPPYLFCFESDEFFSWRYGGWATVICVNSLDEALRVAERLELYHEGTGDHVGSQPRNSRPS